MSEIIFLVEDDPSGGFTAHALGASIFTEGQNREELLANIREAVSCHYPDAASTPKVVRLHFVRDEVFAL